VIASTGTALYVYGVVVAPPPTETGLAFVESGTLAAITSPVSLDEYGEEPLARNLNNRAWLETKARAHEDVLRSVAAVADVLPFRFGTICRGEHDVRALLDDRCDALTAALERVAGRFELGVKLWVDRARLDGSLLDPAADSSQASGRAYLEARRSAQQRKNEADALCVETARTTFERLLEHAVEGVANRPQPRELTCRDDDMLLNAAFLVGSGETRLVEEIARIDAELHGRGFSLEATGPWPPYNFADVEGSA
jgi:Gas vesicle synthesis protein GvpL/GvpF